jgi:hypothetical protein
MTIKNLELLFGWCSNSTTAGMEDNGLVSQPSDVLHIPEQRQNPGNSI